MNQGIRNCTLFLLLLWASAVASTAVEPDLLLADFEGTDYGDWKATGEAFGPGPARGTLPNQMEVTGFHGNGLVNTYFHGDGTTGTLTSPPFPIERKYVNFLLGGGWHPGKACINLLVDGETVRTATGPNRKPGGTERLAPYSWDVSELKGKTARIEIVDNATGGWGHINVDHIRQSNRRTGVVSTVRDIRIERDYMTFRIGGVHGARSSVDLLVDDQLVRSSVGTDAGSARWISWDVSKLKGKSGKLRIEELPAADGSRSILDSLVQSDEAKGTLFVVDRLYQETYRPQFHFTAKKNWLNDPNGLVYYKGEYHLFFQHNPSGINWGNMTWGHAVSPDMLHWEQLPHAIEPDELGTIFSGSAVVDWNNTAGFQTGEEKVLVAFYTSAGAHAPTPKPFTQSIAYSNDRGRTWTKYRNNPVIGHIKGSNRDPKVIWHASSSRWVMALYLDGNEYALLTSSNLKEWTLQSTLEMPGVRECPDLFELPVDGDEKNTKWVFWGGNGNYVIGSFDGKTFTKETQPLRSEWGNNGYAGQTWSDIPESDGRRLQMLWMSGGRFPEMPFNQQMTFPCEVTLRTFPEGIRLCRQPVQEIESLHGEHHNWRDLLLKPGQNPLAGVAGELFHIRAEIELGDAAEVGFTVRGVPVSYNVKEKKLTCLGKSAPLDPVRGAIELRIIVDRTSIEIFANGGRIAMSFSLPLAPEDNSLGAFVRGGRTLLKSLDLWHLKSVWPQKSGARSAGAPFFADLQPLPTVTNRMALTVARTFVSPGE